ncbi:NADH dehydrogenase subunit E [Actibacterium atlanticum]|uniref:NADH dehydrogenase subunit E n=1 Tax=Actibacterium atlanticum TaxID=1461693 RepID=A0A058ZQR5_9RHOB|nr:hypothetical protein [Actibacterium atlanticum]KCV83171.1 NADH dehydrogenase subunit E [Actibacterium atlanticum]
MSEGSNGLGCPLKLWIISAVVGAVVTLALVAGGYAWLAAIFLGIVTCGLLGLLLTWLICVSPQEGPRRQAAFGEEDPDAIVAQVVQTAPAETASKSEPAPTPTPKPVQQAAPAPEAVPAPEAAPEPAPAPLAAVEEDTDEVQPVTLSAARAEGADDLKKIKGVGPKLEGVLNELGFYHYDQIAAWSEAEVAWVDARLKFKGRIERDGWIAQAAELAKG